MVGMGDVCLLACLFHRHTRLSCKSCSGESEQEFHQVRPVVRGKSEKLDDRRKVLTAVVKQIDRRRKSFDDFVKAFDGPREAVLTTS